MSKQSESEADLDGIANCVESLKSLNETKAQMDKFEAKMSKLVELSLEKLHKEIKSALKELESETGNDWEPFLDEFNYYDWIPGEFQEHIGNWLKGDINREASKLPSHADYSE